MMRKAAKPGGGGIGGGKAVKTKSAAIITVRDAHIMTPKGRKEIAAWMRKSADTLVKHGKEFGPRFTYRYQYTPGVAR
jgi:hypothetical protein